MVCAVWVFLKTWPATIGTVRSLIVGGAMGQIPRSTERISSIVG